MRRSFSHIHSHSFAGKRFKIVWRRPDADSEGQCDPPDAKAKKIFIDPNLPEKDLLKAVVHEGTHGGCFSLDEDTVENLGNDVGELLWRMGWRLEE